MIFLLQSSIDALKWQLVFPREEMLDAFIEQGDGRKREMCQDNTYLLPPEDAHPRIGCLDPV